MRTEVIFASKTVLRLLMISTCLTFSGEAAAQGEMKGGWADENDPVAKYIVEKERQWATMGCMSSDAIAKASTAFLAEFIADDFVGTSPKGPLYTKVDMTPKPGAAPRKPQQDCKLLSAKVRFFGPDVAMIYGRESAVIEGPDGKKATRTLVWTDTAMRRAGKWQLIGVQDMVVPND